MNLKIGRTEINLAHLNLAPDDKIKQVYVGIGYTVYLTEQGRCFACGMNASGQFGVGDNEGRNLLTEISFAHLNLAPEDKIKRVFIDTYHIVYLTEQGRCFACGLNHTGQLGIGDNEDRNLLQKLVSHI